MRHIITLPAIGLALLTVTACSSESEEVQSQGRHVWKDQVESIDKAREVETILKRKHEQRNQQ